MRARTPPAIGVSIGLVLLAALLWYLGLIGLLILKPCNATTTLIRSQSYLGAQYRRLRTRLGAPKAITAMARKLACLFYRLIKHGQQSVAKGMEYYEARYREQQIRSLMKRAQKLGFQLVTPTTA
jgi:hypothetical protein